MKKNKEDKVFLVANGATICVSRVMACIPMKSNPQLFRLYFDNGLTITVSKNIAKDLTLALQSC